MTSAEVAARKAALAQFRASFNAFRNAYNAALQAMQPFAAEYTPMMVALDVMAKEVNKASPAVTAAIQNADALVPSDGGGHTVPPVPPPVPGPPEVVFWIEEGGPSGAAELLMASGYTVTKVTPAQAVAAIQET